MQIKCPANFDNITLGQISAWDEQELIDVKLVAIFSDQDEDALRSMPRQAVAEAAKYLRLILSAPSQTLVDTFTLNGKPYGFINDWPNFSGGEYADLAQYLSDPLRNATKIMAILYRPINESWPVGDSMEYTIEPYKGTAGCEVFKTVSASTFYGALAFFLTTTRTYVIDSLLSSEKQLTQILVKNRKGLQTKNVFKRSWAGITRFARWLTAMSRKSPKSQPSQ